MSFIGAKSVISIKISGIFRTTVTLKVSFDFLKIHFLPILSFFYKKIVFLRAGKGILFLSVGG